MWAAKVTFIFIQPNILFVKRHLSFATI